MPVAVSTPATDPAIGGSAVIKARCRKWLGSALRRQSQIRWNNLAVSVWSDGLRQSYRIATWSQLPISSSTRPLGTSNFRMLLYLMIIPFPAGTCMRRPLRPTTREPTSRLPRTVLLRVRIANIAQSLTSVYRGTMVEFKGSPHVNPDDCTGRQLQKNPDYVNDK